MAIATVPKMTLEEYLAYDDGTNTRYEFVDGVLVAIGAENDENNLICMFLISIFLQFVPYYCLRRGTEVIVPSSYITCRIPDLMVLTEKGAIALPAKARSLIKADMPAPALVVEVVSPGEPGEPNYDRDYIEKRREYAARGIPEYWIIDPERQVVLVQTLTDKVYQEQRFAGVEAIVSATFPKLNLSAEQVLKAAQ
jgi:Uma2 family endonuclease